MVKFPTAQRCKPVWCIPLVTSHRRSISHYSIARLFRTAESRSTSRGNRYTILPSSLDAPPSYLYRPSCGIRCRPLWRMDGSSTVYTRWSGTWTSSALFWKLQALSPTATTPCHFQLPKPAFVLLLSVLLLSRGSVEHSSLWWGSILSTHVDTNVTAAKPFLVSVSDGPHPFGAWTNL